MRVSLWRRAGLAIREAVRELRRHPLRTLLTAVTSAVAIAVTVNVISLAYGMDRDIQEDVSSFGRRTIDIARIPIVLPGVKRPVLDDAVYARVRSLVAPMNATVVGRRQRLVDVRGVASTPDGVPDVGAAQRLEDARGDGAQVDEVPIRDVQLDDVQMVCAPRTIAKTVDLALDAGRWWSEDDEQAKRATIVVDAALARLLTDEPKTLIGRWLIVDREPAVSMQIVGVLSDPIRYRALFDEFDAGRTSRTLTSGMLSFRNIYAPLHLDPLTLEHGGDPGEWSGFSVVARTEDDVAPIAQTLRTVWPDTEADLMAAARQGIMVFLRREWMDLLGDSTEGGALVGNIIWMLIVLIAAVLLATLNLVTVRERFDAFAIRRVEGARKGDIALQVGWETVITSLAGGLMGLPLGHAGAALLRHIVQFPVSVRITLCRGGGGDRDPAGGPRVRRARPARGRSRSRARPCTEASMSDATRRVGSSEDASREASPVAGEARGVPVLALDRVARTYGAGDVAVDALKPTTLAVDAGDYVAITGPSGSGKSTLLHILGCLDRPTAGTYRLAGTDVSTLDDAALSALRGRAIGFVFQRFHLLRDETARRNVSLPLLYMGLSRSERRRRADEALARVGLTGRERHEPGRLSGGEQQRVALARALVKEPTLLLADEPTGNLDSRSGRVVLDLLREQHARGTTIVLITHDPTVAGEGRRQLTIHDGVVQEAEGHPKTRATISS